MKGLTAGFRGINGITPQTVARDGVAGVPATVAPPIYVNFAATHDLCIPHLISQSSLWLLPLMSL